MKTAELTQAEVDRNYWHHTIDFGGQIVSKGEVPLDVLQKQADIYFRDVKGKSVIDIGCWDGFNSFEAVRRGASRVMATDHFVWATKKGSRDNFELGRRYIAPSVEVMDIDLPDHSPETVGRFDVVLWAGIFYHLRDPFTALRRAAALADEWLIVETLTGGLDIKQPAMIFTPLGNKTQPWWAPNHLCVEQMMFDAGCLDVETIVHPVHIHNRAIFRGRMR